MIELYPLKLFNYQVSNLDKLPLICNELHYLCNNSSNFLR